jgi:hypothetical protein
LAACLCPRIGRRMRASARNGGRRDMGEQMRILWPDAHTPGDCPEESAVVAIGGGKSYCKAWGCWTNCREMGHCVRDAWAS